MLKSETIARLEARQEELALLFLDDSNIEYWKTLSRGNAYWEKKNAAQSIGLVVRLQTILTANVNKTPMAEGAQEKLARKAEAEANALIQKLRAKQQTP